MRTKLEREPTHLAQNQVVIPLGGEGSTNQPASGSKIDLIRTQEACVAKKERGRGREGQVVCERGDEAGRGAGASGDGGGGRGGAPMAGATSRDTCL